MKEDKNLYRLKELTDYEVADDDSDVRGWKVYSADNKPIATVNELLVDLKVMRVRYLDIILNPDVRGDDEDNYMLIPIGAARLDEKENKVFVDYIETLTLLKIPKYKGENVTRNYETKVRQALISDDEKVSADKFYSHELYDENNFYKSRNKILSLNETNRNDILNNNPDVRNESVLNSTGEKIGKVRDILFDGSSNKMRYLVIEIEDNNLKDNLGKKIILPIGAAVYNEKEKIVITKLAKEEILDFPDYSGGYVSRMYEESVRRKIHQNISNNNEFYDNEFYNSNSFFSHKM